MKTKTAPTISIQDNGFTLVELLFVTAIMAFVLTAALQLYLKLGIQVNQAKNLTWAMTDAQVKIEEIRNESFDNITTNYGSGGLPGDAFDTQQVPGKGKIYITALEDELLEIKIVLCWEGKSGRIIGEDIDLDGTLDEGEDTDGDGQISSPVTLITYLSKR